MTSDEVIRSYPYFGKKKMHPVLCLIAVPICRLNRLRAGIKEYLQIVGYKEGRLAVQTIFLILCRY
jgi:hypothetical protein